MLTQSTPIDLTRTGTPPESATPCSPGPAKRSWRRIIFAILASGGLGGTVIAVHVKQTGQLPFLHRENVWSVAIYEGDDPFHLRPISADQRPSLTAQDVTDVPALFVADPFMVQEGERWHLFVEVLNKNTGQGDIGYASSLDGHNWDYEGIVLDESFHLSYPSVFFWEGVWYMVPEAEASGEVRLYQAEEFPRKWKFVQHLIQGEQLADPTLFRHANRWWMFVGRSHTHDQLQLYYADSLSGPWQVHPNSPLIDHDANQARPGGPVVEIDGSLYRFAQDCDPKYGNQLRAFRIRTLSTRDYVEEPIDPSPLLTPGSAGWNSNGMHHYDLHLLPNGRWRAVVDGHRKEWIWQATP